MYEGLTSVQRKKLQRFEELAEQGAHARALLRPLMNDPVLMKRPEVYRAMSRLREKKLGTSKGAPHE